MDRSRAWIAIPGTLVFILGLAAAPVGAQGIEPAIPPIVAPPPPPPPAIVVPKVPALGETTVPVPLPPPRPDFHTRVKRCLDEGAAAGLGPNGISSYSGRCVDR